MQKKPTHIKNYLKSKSPETLKVLMLRNSLETKCYHDYYIVHDGAAWFAWFEMDAESIIENEVKRLTDEEQRNG